MEPAQSLFKSGFAGFRGGLPIVSWLVPILGKFGGGAARQQVFPTRYNCLCRVFLGAFL
jgi:hypothetical protein